MVIYNFLSLYYYQESLNYMFKAFGSCEQEFMANSDGQISTQLLANADVAGQDGEASILFCNNFIIGFERVSFFSGFVQEMWSASANHALSHLQMT